MGVGLGLTAEEADDSGSADKSTLREFIQGACPTHIFKFGVVDRRGDEGDQVDVSPSYLARPARDSNP